MAAAVFLANIEEDDICIRAAENFELNNLLNDNEDAHILNVPENLLLLNDGNDDLFLEIETNNNIPVRSVPISSALQRIQNVWSRSVIGRTYLNEYFFSFDQWPQYMFDLFTSNNIQNYSYRDRNKICIFFWGNGGEFQIMANLCQFFAPPPRLTTANDHRANESSRRKCVELFNTYNQQRFNPNYSRRYYYYSMVERRMLYIDGQPRHYGQRQENGLLNRFPAWY